MRLRLLFAIAAFGGLVIVSLSAWNHYGNPAGEAASAEVIAQGRLVYAERCAACHGANLEGQPDWRSPLPSGRLPAPPHDGSGHTWHHPDHVLFRIVNEGTAAVVGGNYTSDMPGFGDVLDEAEIWAVLAFIKGSWPERERLHQEAISARR